MRKHHKQALATIQTVAMEENVSQSIRNVLRLVEKATMEEAHSALALLDMAPGLPSITCRLCCQLRYRLEVEIRSKAEEFRGACAKAPAVEEAEPPTH